MNTQEALRTALQLNRTVLMAYISDLNDEELFIRLLPETKHIAWQLGHLVAAERGLLEYIKPGMSPELPEKFAENHDKEKWNDDARENFCSKEVYMDVLTKQRNATLQVLESLSDEELDREGVERMRQIAPTVGAMFALIAAHDLMHAGQFVAVRRKLGKPILI